MIKVITEEQLKREFILDNYGKTIKQIEEKHKENLIDLFLPAHF